MTKPEPVEVILKGSLTFEETSRVSLEQAMQKLIEENGTKLRVPQVFVEPEPKLKLARVKKATRPRRSRLCRITQRLYNLETDNEPEKPLNIELNLYQMETC